MFARWYVRGLCALIPALVQLRKKDIPEVLYALAKDAIILGGYRSRSEKFMAKQVSYLMNMPRVQAEIEENMAARGLGMSHVAATLAKIMNGEVKTKRTITNTDKDGNESTTVIEDGVSPSDMLRAIDMRIRATTGYAPSTSKTMNVNANVSSFDAKVFDQTPAIRLDPRLSLGSTTVDEESSNGDHAEDCVCEECGGEFQ